MKQCNLCDEHGWHYRKGSNWSSYFPHGATIQVDSEGGDNPTPPKNGVSTARAADTENTPTTS